MTAEKKFNWIWKKFKKKNFVQAFVTDIEFRYCAVFIFLKTDSVHLFVSHANQKRHINKLKHIYCKSEHKQAILC